MKAERTGQLLIPAQEAIEYGTKQLGVLWLAVWPRENDVDNENVQNEGTRRCHLKVCQKSMHDG